MELKIEFTANDLTASIDISVLQERLTNMINLGPFNKYNEHGIVIACKIIFSCEPDTKFIVLHFNGKEGEANVEEDRGQDRLGVKATIQPPSREVFAVAVIGPLKQTGNHVTVHQQKKPLQAVARSYCPNKESLKLCV
ncbi:Uncharacterized protein Fot_27060 [Forsythia ovata]|uniref:Uncharacterized protein n=1 Tax=Forsythia ovata TaxID=205694 RepID=A0ABD1UDL8_9LAMI